MPGPVLCANYRGHQCFTNTYCYFRFYDREIRAYQILNGEVDRPEECQALYDVLQMHRERAQKAAIDMAKKQAIKQAEAGSERLRDKFNIPIPVCMHSTFISTLGGLDSLHFTFFQSNYDFQAGDTCTQSQELYW